MTSSAGEPSTTPTSARPYVEFTILAEKPQPTRTPAIPPRAAPQVTTHTEPGRTADSFLLAIKQYQDREKQGVVRASLPSINVGAADGKRRDRLKQSAAENEVVLNQPRGDDLRSCRCLCA